MAVFVTKHIPQSSPRLTPDTVKDFPEREGGNTDVPRRPVVAPTEGESTPSQIDTDLLQLSVEEAVGL